MAAQRPALMRPGTIEKLEHFVRRPEQATMRVGGDSYVLARADSFLRAWIEEMERVLDRESAFQLLYRLAWRIAAQDAAQFRFEPDLTENRLIPPILLPDAATGRALVQILPDSSPQCTGEFFLHFVHPGTFESEVARGWTVRDAETVCAFTAGYSAGWCSNALQIELHAREVQCVARGGDSCEFVLGHRDVLASRLTTLSRDELMTCDACAVG